MGNLNRLIKNYIACLEMYENKTDIRAKNFWKDNVEYWGKRIEMKLNIIGKEKSIEDVFK